MEAAKLRREDKLTRLMKAAVQKKNTLDYQEIMEILGEDRIWTRNASIRHSRCWRQAVWR